MVKLNSSVEHSTSAVPELRWLATMYNVLQLLWSLKKKPEIHQSSKQQALHCSAKTDHPIACTTTNYYTTPKNLQCQNILNYFRN
jgi:hypothetical protein